MASAVVVLERHAEQRRKLAADPRLLSSALEEVLRWHGVTQYVARVVARETQIAGVPLAPGDIVYAMTGAANRDPARWAEPHRFDIFREGKSHLAFGYGPHLCIGLWLARLEAKAGLRRLLELVPEYRLSRVEYASAFLRGPERAVLEATTAAAV
jgi:cytochrome P450